VCSSIFQVSLKSVRWFCHCGWSKIALPHYFGHWLIQQMIITWRWLSVGETAALDESDVDPCELFVAIGMLVLESRLPTASVKGRRDGLHCPQAVGHWSSHECDLTQPQVASDLLVNDVLLSMGKQET